ncbi:MAG: hypothetical protein AUJ21_07845 [Anaerolineae bacterium CG1_02_58_13]|nr:MAG: hypothetical protein AUJ21_07845 [Anaerolineae bacterium CG1_02_58_13]
MYVNGRCILTIYCKPNISALDIGIARDLNILKSKTAGNWIAVETGSKIDFVICVGKSAVAWVYAAIVTSLTYQDSYILRGRKSRCEGRDGRMTVDEIGWISVARAGGWKVIRMDIGRGISPCGVSPVAF